jgi:hypothetical protein
MLDNKSVPVNAFMTQTSEGRPAIVNFNLKVHDLNDTRYTIDLYLVGQNAQPQLLDRKVIEPAAEIFITNITYMREAGVLKDTAYIDIWIYNRIASRPEGSLTLTIYGALLINTISVYNNATVEAGSYWHLEDMRMDLPKGPASFKVVVYYDSEDEDTESLYMN